MKKIFIFSLIILAFLPKPYIKALAEEENFYAKVQTSGVMFYSDKSAESAVFEIPYSYFVKVNAVDGDYFSATYKNFSGYVKKNQVKLMKGTPKLPYAQNSFRVFTPFYLYESASKASAIQCELTESTPVEYYGTLDGQALNSTTSQWLFGSVVSGDQTYFGYVYSALVNVVPSPLTNTEIFEVVNEEALNSTNGGEFSTLSNGTKVMLIISISLPSILILYFLIKPSKIAQITKTRKQIKKEHKKVSHGDYFEFDETQL